MRPLIENSRNFLGIPTLKFSSCRNGNLWKRGSAWRESFRQTSSKDHERRGDDAVA